MFEGRVTQRLCPKTEFSHEVIPEHETPRLEFEYSMYLLFPLTNGVF